jgi:hypothetical protein
MRKNVTMLYCDICQLEVGEFADLSQYRCAVASSLSFETPSGVVECNDSLC